MQVIREMLADHWFWGIVMLAVLVWYSTITVYVSIRGCFDIKHMLAELGRRNDQSPPS